MLAKFLKDAFCKYKTMCGKQVYRKIGWDTHGLPVEVKVEKDLGFNGKADIEKYGIDKPDLRNPLEIIDISDVFADSDFKPFRGVCVRGIKVDDIGDKSNSWFNELVDYASSIGMPGIGYITLMEDGSLKGPIDKFLSEEERNNLIKDFDMKTNSVMFFIANRNLKVAQKFAGQIRDELGRKLDLIDNDRIELAIIKDFPMFEYDDKEKKWDFCHNPFSKPKLAEGEDYRPDIYQWLL